MPSVDVNGVRINYLQLPSDAGPDSEDLVMVHGLATNLSFWYLSHAEALSKRFRVTLFDLRGHGRSGMTQSGYTVKNLAADLRLLLDHLGIKRAHFIAHSFGGAIALRLACDEPARISSLTLADTHLSAVRRLHANNWRFAERLKRLLRQNNIALDVKQPYFGYQLLREIARLKVGHVEITKELHELISPLMGQNGRTAAQWLRLIETTRAEQEIMAEDGLSLSTLRALDCPILAMYGEWSQAMATGLHLLEVWPHADFRRMRESGHFFHVTRPADFLATCDYFWRTRLAQAVPRREFDLTGTYFRSNRFYNRNGLWLYDTREAREIGPFPSIEEAKGHLLNAILSVAA